MEEQSYSNFSLNQINQRFPFDFFCGILVLERILLQMFMCLGTTIADRGENSIKKTEAVMKYKCTAII